MRHLLSKLVLVVSLVAFALANGVAPRLAYGGPGAVIGEHGAADAAYEYTLAALPCHGQDGATSSVADSAAPGEAAPDHPCCTSVCAALGFPPLAALLAGPRPAATPLPALAPVLAAASPAALDRPPRNG